MSINSISSKPPVQVPVKAAPVEAAQTPRASKEVKADGDSDDGSKAAKTSAPKPVTNTLGQLIGRNVNVSA
ncbi:hypothetical protein GALL_465380 [mine drainage metagenome]|uniref:Uncharacterized protein n=1 Tax=mine drainage metagenome TaxID=410659 RepID=A0A1J5PWC2_9ZZZZ